MFYKVYTGTCCEELIKVILRENSLEEEYTHFSTLLKEKRLWYLSLIISLHALEISPLKDNK